MKSVENGESGGNYEEIKWDAQSGMKTLAQNGWMTHSKQEKAHTKKYNYKT